MRLGHSITLHLSFGILLLFSSCAEKPLVDDTIYEDNENLGADVVEQKTITGSFRSVQGVMNELSCYCSNGGYVKTADGTEVAVCFKSEVVVPSCDKITVTGYMTSKSIQSNGACPAGIMGFLKVQEYIVGESDY